MRTLLGAAVLALFIPAAAAQPQRPGNVAPQQSGEMSSGGMVDLSLVEALAAIKEPQLAGLFSFIQPKDAPFAFGDLLARDPKALKRYLNKLDDDKETANGLTGWDHEVCASLVNMYNSPMGAAFGKPDKKRLSRINNCVLAAVVPLQEIVARRKR